MYCEEFLLVEIPPHFTEKLDLPENFGPFDQKTNREKAAHAAELTVVVNT